MTARLSALLAAALLPGGSALPPGEPAMGLLGGALGASAVAVAVAVTVAVAVAVAVAAVLRACREPLRPAVLQVATGRGTPPPVLRQAVPAKDGRPQSRAPSRGRGALPG